jgi:hypothetical protein
MLKDIKALLPKAIKRAGISKKVEQEEILKLFRQVCTDFLSPAAAAKIKPLYLFDQILTVVSISEESLQEFKNQEAKIIKRINKILGELEIKKIRLIA